MDVGPQCGKGFLEAGRAVDDGEFRRLQATFDKVIEKCPPGGFALPADYYATWVLDPDDHDVEVVDKTGQID